LAVPAPPHTHSSVGFSWDCINLQIELHVFITCHLIHDNILSLRLFKSLMYLNKWFAVSKTSCGFIIRSLVVWYFSNCVILKFSCFNCSLQAYKNILNFCIFILYLVALWNSPSKITTELISNSQTLQLTSWKCNFNSELCDRNQLSNTFISLPTHKKNDKNLYRV
jgi:hypothetical protein